MRLLREDDVLDIIERVTNEAVEKKWRKYLIQPRIIAEIAALKPVDAELVKHGKWMGTVCTACGESDSLSFNHNFCPNCGARMDGDENDKIRK